MKYLLIVVFVSLIGGGYAVSKQLEDYTLISDTERVSGDIVKSQGGTFFIRLRDDRASYYEFISANGLFEIFKKLWGVFALFALLFVALIPLSVATLQRWSDKNIDRLNQAVADANTRADNAERKQIKIAEEKFHMRNVAAEKITTTAKNKIEECENLKIQLSKESEKSNKSRDNAVAAMQRRKKKAFKMEASAI